MTDAQRYTINQLRAKKYSIATLGYYGTQWVKVRVRRKLRPGYFYLLVFPNGTYECPEYNEHYKRKVGSLTWVN